VFTMAATQAFAQSAPAQSAPAADAAGAVSDVIVTAQRRSENLQNVPIAVTSFSAASLATQHITSAVDLGRVVPNMFASNNVGQASANVYYIRGLGQTQSFPTFEPQVGTYVDDIYIGRQNANNLSLFGVQQIQVLNGPQGTLFGRNSTGGAVLVTLQPPADTFGGSLEVGYGAYNRFFGRASVDMPINDQVKTRTSIFGISDDGYVQDQTTHVLVKLVVDRQVVAVDPVELGNLERCGSLSDRGLGRSPGNDVRHQEDEQSDAQDDDDRLPYASQEVAQHSRSSLQIARSRPSRPSSRTVGPRRSIRSANRTERRGYEVPGVQCPEGITW